jgi:hypothetical protein
VKFLTPKKAVDLEREIQVIIENAVSDNGLGLVDVGQISPDIAAKEIIDYLKKNHIITIKKK